MSDVRPSHPSRLSHPSRPSRPSRLGPITTAFLRRPALEVKGLTTAFEQRTGYVNAVDQVSFCVGHGEIVAIVGESGSGKSVLLQSILGLVRGTPGVVAGQVVLRFRDGSEHAPYAGIEQVRPVRRFGRPIPKIHVPRPWRARVERALRPLRGRRIGLVLQNGRAALDPFYTVGQQLTAVIPAAAHAAQVPQAEAWLERLGFDDPGRTMRLYPHELSGGMAQRVMLAVVLAQEPEILLLDEMTTGLDVSLQASVMELLAGLYEEVGFTAVLVTHELGLARALATRTVIMKQGRVDMDAPTDALFDRRVPLTPYADRLVKHGYEAVARPTPETDDFSEDEPTDPLVGTGQLLRAERVGKSFGGRGWGGSPRQRALADIDLAVEMGECVAFVGESGSGKTTLTRVLSGLSRPDEGQVVWGGRPLGQLTAAMADRLRRRRTVLFQNPYTSLNPALTAREAVAEALSHDLELGWRSAFEEAARRLEVVGLQHRAHQVLGRLSGGERRRVGLLVALQSPGELLVLDEPTAGLDAEHRAGVRRLIRSAHALMPQRTVLLVSHDLGFVVGTADRVVVLYRGRVVEEGRAEDFVDPERPHHPYTQLLWDASQYVAGATPDLSLDRGRLDEGGLNEGEEVTFIGALNQKPGEGCAFRDRCSIYRADTRQWTDCETLVPPLRGMEGRRRIACHGVRDADLQD